MDLIAEYERHLRRLDRSPKTVAFYIRVLRQADRDLPMGLCSATTEELEDWLFTPSPNRRGGPQRGKTTRSHYSRILRGFGKWATNPKRPRLDFDATADLPDIKPAKAKSKPTREDALTQLLAQDEHRLWFLLAAYAGLRCIEISRLDRSDVTQERIWLHGKGDKERYVPTHPLIWEAIKDLPAGPIAVDHDGVTRLTEDQVSHRGNHRISRTVGPRVTSMHKLRHRFATQSYEATQDLVAVQELLGHSAIDMTRKYVDTNHDRMAAAVASLPVAV